MSSSAPYPPRLLSLATAVPPHVLEQEDVVRRARQVFNGRARDFERLVQVYGNAGIERRYSVVPIEWYLEPHGWVEKTRLFLDGALSLLERATRSSLERARLAVEDIDAVVAVSSTGIATPSLDALLMERLSLRRDTARLPIFGLGCAGGVVGLGHAATLAAAKPGSRVLYLVVELCGITFRTTDTSKSNIIATALFGDGAAAAVISTEGDGPALTHSGVHTWQNTLDVMGWRVEEDGLGVLFSRDIPALVRSEFGPAVMAFLARHGKRLADIDSFVCHPGGAKVIAALEETFGLQEGGLAHARSVLRDYGNMSAATVLFVLERTLAAADGPRHLLSALGPGFSAGFLTLEPA
ncbi:MAG: type III polyketide synthase [Proteobacteria bacterium]|nr:type III polyketide synthase [Pseudomonadota bacterium]MBI3498848.1 type III polyketide synthase [Pseudomonadota bacterium]